MTTTSVAIAIALCLGCSSKSSTTSGSESTPAASTPEPKTGAATTGTPTTATPTTGTPTGSAATPGTPTSPATGGVFGWWDIPDVEAAEDMRGGAMKLEPERLSFVTKAGTGVVRTCKTTVTGKSTIEVSITGCGVPVTATFTGDELTFTKGLVGGAQGFTATRTLATKVAKLDELAQQGASICERARACYRLAYPLLGHKLNEDFDFGPGPSADTCTNMIDGFAKDLRKVGKRVPVPCAK